MARLEIDIVGNNTELKKVLDDSKIALSKFNKELSGNELKVAKVETEALRQSLILQRKETEKARTAAQEVRKEIAEWTLANRQNKQATEAANGSYDEARQRLASLRRAIFEAKGGFDGTRPSINAMIKEYNTLNDRLKAFDAQMGNHQRNVGNYALGLGNANGVTMEFTRIIQDAPYGMMGIGNNIQQLTENWKQYVIASKAASAAQGITLTNGMLLKGALTSLISPLSLLTLGIAAVTSGITYYNNRQQKANKEIKEATENVKLLANNYSLMNGVLGEDSSLKKAIGDINSLKINVDLAQKGIIKKSDVVKEYNKIIGDSAGKLKEFSDVENFIVQKSDAYIQAMMLRAAANLALEEAAKSAVKAQQLALEPPKIDVKKVSDNSIANQFLQNQATNITEAGKVDRKSLQEDAKKTEKEFTDIAAELQKKVGEINKKYGFNFFGGTSESNSDSKSKNQFDVYRDSLSEFDQKLYDIEKRYDEIFKSVNKDLFGLAKANKEAEILRVNMEEIAKSMGLKSVGAGSITPTFSSVPTSEALRNSTAGFMAGVSSKFADKEAEQLQKEISRIVKSGVRRGFDDIIGNIDNLGSNFYQVFTNVFGKLASSIQGTLNDIIGNSLGNLINESFGDIKFGNLSKEVSQGIVAGIGALGNVLGGMFKGTDTVGQGLSGALSGAAAGMAFGPLGALAGGLIGALSGIFGAKERKKQLELQEQQLAEQRKQTLLQERANALAYSSSIVGQMTNRGIVQGVDVNEFGELKVRIEGRDLVAVMSKEQQAQKRGL